MPCIAYLAFPVVARFLCGGRKGTFAYRVGQLSILALGLGSLGLAAYLFQAGDKARWQSDGPGILGLILAMLAFAAFALVFGAMFIGTLTRDDSDEEGQARAGAGGAGCAHRAGRRGRRRPALVAIAMS